MTAWYSCPRAGDEGDYRRFFIQMMNLFIWFSARYNTGYYNTLQYNSSAFFIYKSPRHSDLIQVQIKETFIFPLRWSAIACNDGSIVIIVAHYTPQTPTTSPPELGPSPHWHSLSFVSLFPSNPFLYYDSHQNKC
jgi:hypothetical protein